jgi:hypothetical protein
MEEEEEEGTGVSCSWSRGDVPSPTPGVELSGGLGKVSTIVSLDTLKLFLDPETLKEVVQCFKSTRKTASMEFDLLSPGLTTAALTRPAGLS